MNERHSLQNIYRANRAAGHSAQRSIEAARYIRATLDALEGFTAEFPFGDPLQATFTLEDTNAGVTLEYEIYRDHDGSPDDAECYDAADVEAWARDEWHYYGYSVTATMGRFSVTESLWGIEAGDYWESAARPLDTEQQIMALALEYHPVRAMIEAVQDRAITACLS